jgi:predicted DNA-binding transcriptional regulator YafY
MKDDPPLLRQWLLIRLLGNSGDGVTVNDLAEELQVSVKTIRRDLDVLQVAGFPIIDTDEEFGRKRWRLAHDQPAGWVFTYDEALALCLAQRFLDPLAGTFFWQAAQKAFRKLRTGFGPKVLRYLSKVDGALYQTSSGASDYQQQAEIIDELLIAIEERRAVFLTYQSQQATEPVTYDIYPYGLSYHRGSLYLVGYAPRHEELRHWKVDRIEEAEIAELQFPRPSNFDLRQHFSDSFGIYGGSHDEPIHIVVRFSRDVSRYVSESTWHASQRLTKQSDGSTLAEFDLSSTVEIKSWVMSFGRHAEVLEPEGLREEMLEEATALLAMMTTKRKARHWDGCSRENEGTAINDV